MAILRAELHLLGSEAHGQLHLLIRKVDREYMAMRADRVQRKLKNLLVNARPRLKSGLFLRCQQKGESAETEAAGRESAHDS